MFGLAPNSGVVLPYKCLLGNTTVNLSLDVLAGRGGITSGSSSSHTATRVLSSIALKRPNTRRNEFSRDIGVFDVYYRRRRRTRFARMLLGSVRKRWFRWRSPSSFWAFRESMRDY